MSGRTVECGRHGTTGPAFVCRHLAASLLAGPTGLGFVTPVESDEPQAWCAECDAALAAEGGEWNDASEAVAQVTLMAVPIRWRRRWR